MQDKIPAGDIKEKSAFLRWLDNFWYHYKIHTIVVLVGLVVLLVCILQTCANSDSYDMSVLYAGRNAMSQSQELDASNILGIALPEDYNGDGRKTVEFAAYHILSEEQIRQMAAETYEDGDHVYVDRNFYTQEYSNYTNIMSTGEYSVCLLEPWLYEKMVSAERVKPLSEVFTVIPDGAVDEYGIRLGSTELYGYYEALHVLPEDTVVCLMRPYVVGKSSRAEQYAKCIEAFRGIVEFRAPEN